VPLWMALLACGILFAVLKPGEPAQARVTTDVQGTVYTHTTWTLAESPYVVTGDVIVNPDITLTIEPGVKVAFNSKLALFVNGTLVAKGTSSQPIYFTTNLKNPSLDDYWGMIDLRDQSENSVLQHAVIEYGGNATRMGDWCVSGALCVSTSSFTLDASTIQHNATRGLVLRQSDAVISNNTFSDHPNEAIRLHSCNHSIGPCRPSIIGNTFTHNASPIYRVDALDPYISFNQATDNDINGLVLKTPCKFVNANTWYADGLPYVIEAGHCYIGGSGDVSLTIQPGTVIKFGTAGGLKVFSDNYYTGTITATGTTEQPIVFTSLKDDSIGGDTNNDGTASTPVVGDWELLWLEGTKTQGTFEHTEVRYARAGGASGRPAFLVDYGATLMMKDSQLKYGEVGVKFYRPGYGANGQIENTTFSEMSTAGVLVESDGGVSISNSRFENNGVGVYVSNGHPTVSDSFFSGNTTGVEVICTTLAGDCAPVISPHNSFADKTQQGIRTRYPVELCVAARYNWWGDKNGPQDSSSALDACSLADNPGSGAAVSDGVDYSPWDGGLARPLIARPGCGVTARNQPDFTGRAQSGATVSFYDGDTLLGQTTAASDDTFSWTPSVPLEDGEHTITAIAFLGGETSLPSPDLSMTVDSSLPFDPAGVLLSYATHSAVHTQTLKDSSGCASIMGDLDTPIWVRPGSTLTVTIPIRTDLVPGTIEFERNVSHVLVSKRSSEQVYSPATLVTRQVTNNSSHVITGVYSARRDPSLGAHVYQPYSEVITIDEIPPGETRSITYDATSDDDTMDLVFTTDNLLSNVAFSTTIDPKTPADISITDSSKGNLYIENTSGNKIESLYIREQSQTEKGIFGGSFLSPTDPLSNEDLDRFRLPANRFYDIYMYDDQGVLIYRQINTVADFWEEIYGFKTKIKLENSGPGVLFNINNGSTQEICRVRLYRYDDNDNSIYSPDDLISNPVKKLPNLLDFIGNTIPSNGSLSFKLEPGRYFFQAEDCAGNIMDRRKSIEIRGSEKTLPIGARCDTIGSVKVGNKEYPISCPNNPNTSTSSTAVWSDCYSVIEAVADTLGISLCELGSLWDLLMGFILIDPDGYVYDAARGIEAVILGATVTCDMYDEDYQTWERWPAELYEAQINPQVTGTDGYYAFFVPPGLYRVQAVAPGYDPHTSPDIRVIDEIVHYNIPMTGGGGLFLPFVVR